MCNVLRIGNPARRRDPVFDQFGDDVECFLGRSHFSTGTRTTILPTVLPHLRRLAANDLPGLLLPPLDSVVLGELPETLLAVLMAVVLADDVTLNDPSASFLRPTSFDAVTTWQRGTMTSAVFARLSPISLAGHGQRVDVGARAR